VKEVWKNISGYEGLYEVSSLGRVRSLPHKVYNKLIGEYISKEKILKQGSLVRGYKGVGLYKNGKEKTQKVHRLVAEAFIPNPNNYPEVNHKNEDTSDNRVTNLEWCTSKYNSNYGTRTQRIAQKNLNRNKSKRVLQLDLSGNLIHVWPSASETQRNGFSQGNVSACCRGERKTHKGYKWQYAKEEKQCHSII
jgi:hypothetical protein